MMLLADLHVYMYVIGLEQYMELAVKSSNLIAADDFEEPSRSCNWGQD